MELRLHLGSGDNSYRWQLIAAKQAVIIFQIFDFIIYYLLHECRSSFRDPSAIQKQNTVKGGIRNAIHATQSRFCKAIQQTVVKLVLGWIFTQASETSSYTVSPSPAWKRPAWKFATKRQSAGEMGSLRDGAPERRSAWESAPMNQSVWESEHLKVHN